MAIREHGNEWLRAQELLVNGPFLDTRDLFRRTSEKWGSNDAFREKTEDNQVLAHTHLDFYNDIVAAGDGFIDAGLEGKKIALSCGNSYGYVVLYCALSCTGTVIPMEKDMPEPLYGKLLGICDAQVVICTSEIIEKVESIKKTCPAIETIIVSDKKVDGYLYLWDIIEKGRQLRDQHVFENKKIDAEATAFMIFTSGTTGANKCVMLSQKNIMSNIMSQVKLIRTELPNMSVLPMTHGMEINCNILSCVATGRTICICPSVREFVPCLQLFKPGMFTGVPMMAAMILNNIWAGVRKAGKEEELKAGIAASNKLIEQGIDKRQEFFGHLVAPLGGNLKLMVVGGAPVSEDLIKGLFEIGIDIINGYGITECGPLVAMNNDTFHYPQATGEVVDNSEIRIDEPDENEVGELLIKCNSVMNGYYKDPEATNQVMTEDGFFRTGDYAKVIENGMIQLVGRKKNLILLDNGKNVYPEELESHVTDNLPYVQGALVYSAKCNVRGQEVERICCGIDFYPGVQIPNEKIVEDFRKINSMMPVYKRINYVLVQETEFERSPIRKILRQKGIDRHNPDTGLTI